MTADTAGTQFGRVPTPKRAPAQLAALTAALESGSLKAISGKPAALLVYLCYLAHAANGSGEAWPGEARIMSLSGLCADGVRKGRRALEAAGLIVPTGARRSRCMVYKLPPKPRHPSGDDTPTRVGVSGRLTPTGEPATPRRRSDEPPTPVAPNWNELGNNCASSQQQQQGAAPTDPAADAAAGERSRMMVEQALREEGVTGKKVGDLAALMLAAEPSPAKCAAAVRRLASQIGEDARSHGAVLISLIAEDGELTADARDALRQADAAKTRAAAVEAIFQETHKPAAPPPAPPAAQAIDAWQVEADAVVAALSPADLERFRKEAMASAAKIVREVWAQHQNGKLPRGLRLAIARLAQQAVTP